MKVCSSCPLSVRDGEGWVKRGNDDQDQVRRAYTFPSYILPWLPLKRSTTQSVSTFLIRSGHSSSRLCKRIISQVLHRNNFLADRGLPLPKATSTGTTIVGCLFKDGIILGADTRATEGDIVADKNCEKVSNESPLLGSSITSPPRSIISPSPSDAVVLVQLRILSSRQR